MKNTKKTILYIWSKLGKYKLHCIITFTLFGGMVLINDVIVPVYVKKLTDALNLADFQVSYHFVITLFVLYFLARLLLFLGMHMLSWFQSRIARDFDNFSYEHFTKHSYNFYTTEFTGSLISKLKRLGFNVVSIIDHVLFNFYSLLIAVTGIFWVLFRENTFIGFIFLGFLIIYSALLMLMSKKMAPLYKERSIAKSQYSGVASDILTNIYTVMFFENRSVDFNLYKKSTQNFHEKRYRSWKNAVNYQDGIGFIPPIFTALVTFFAVHLATTGILTIGSVILVFLLANNLGSQLWRMGSAVRRFTSDISDTIESIEIIEKPVEVIDIENPQPSQIQAGKISFQDISFTYPDGDHVFENFSLDIPAGQSVGIVGKSGSGKTTITKLLLRLYDVDAGEISIDNQNIAQVTQRDLRHAISYIPQETILFHRTIYENIAYGNPDAERDDVINTAKSAHVDEFVENLEHGYETKVGERGVKLSGGQRQRVGIARAMLKSDSPILMLDEATSSLDSKSEAYIQDSFEKLSKNRTTIVIAHRLSTIQKLDRIIVMEKGNIIEDGSHDELMKSNGHYADLWNSQINGFMNDENEIGM